MGKEIKNDMKNGMRTSQKPDVKTADKKPREGRGKSVRRPLHLPENPQFLLEGALLVGAIAYLFYDTPLAAGFLSPLLIARGNRKSLQASSGRRSLPS